MTATPPFFSNILCLSSIVKLELHSELNLPAAPFSAFRFSFIPHGPKSTPPQSPMAKKRVLVGYGVDIDAVAGWLGSYGGEDSSSDISRGPQSHLPYNPSLNSPRFVRRHNWSPPTPQALRKEQLQSNVVHSRTLSRYIPRRVRLDP